LAQLVAIVPQFKRHEGTEPREATSNSRVADDSTCREGAGQLVCRGADPLVAETRPLPRDFGVHLSRI
jgi:hypothetical protein